jgi:predicted HAD superfamily Cof-like phosphohydrolase
MLFRDNPVFPAEALKELADLVYVAYQYAANMGWDLDEALNRVHLSNMSKLDDDGNPIYRDDGKVLKGPNYKPPTLTDLI